jgi:hypothetical protein
MKQPETCCTGLLEIVIMGKPEVRIIVLASFVAILLGVLANASLISAVLMQITG